jgi:hypothetical protein
MVLEPTCAYRPIADGISRALSGQIDIGAYEAP